MAQFEIERIKQVEEFIFQFFQKELTFPSIDEICEHFEWRSKNSAFKYVQTLIDIGTVRKWKGRYTINPEFFQAKFEHIKSELEEETEYWKRKKEYFDRIRNN